MKLTRKIVSMMGLGTLFFAACLIQPTIGSARIEPATKTIRPYVAWSGSDSKITTPVYQRVTSRPAWIKLWNAHLGNSSSTTSNIDGGNGVPNVDFDTCFVVAIFKGKSTNNAGVSAHLLTTNDNTVKLRYSNAYFQTGKIGIAGNAYGIFVFPRTTNPILIEEAEQDRIGAEVQWKERARWERL